MKAEIISIETARIMADIEKENKMLIEALEINHKIIDKYEERINKAIKFINNKWQKEKYYQNIENCIEFCEFDRNDLLNILKG